MFDRLYRQIIDKISISQFGSLQGSSTVHYLVDLLDFVYKSLDNNNSYVIIVLLDLSKAFDLVDHNILINELIRLEVNMCDVLWLSDFLYQRSQCVKEGNQLSKFCNIFNGTPQGTKLAPLLFVIVINRILVNFRDKYQVQSNCSNIFNGFVDDMTLAERVSFKSAPLMQNYLNDITQWTRELKMKLNPVKCNVLVINKSRCNQIDVKLTMDNVLLPKITSTKLLGVQLNDTLNWDEHVDIVVRKACKKIYVLRKLKYCGFSKNQLITVYKTYIRSNL
jgi:hypothetical protein